jgi:hypothetical protein
MHVCTFVTACDIDDDFVCRNTLIKALLLPVAALARRWLRLVLAAL